MPRGRLRLCWIDARRARRAIGVALRRAREARGWSQLQLSSAVGVSQATVSRWEVGVGRLDVGDLFALASVLGRNAVDMLQEAA